MKKVWGIGINNYEGIVNIKGKNIKSYDCWKDMLKRCYSPREQEKRPTYKDCSVIEEWHLFSNFKKWYDENYKEGYHLDKDLLYEGNKVYSPITCIFLPRKINNFFSNKQSNNTSGYTGVSCDNKAKKYEAEISNFETGKKQKLGRFKDPQIASEAYKLARYKNSLLAYQYLLNEGFEECIASIIIGR